MVYFRSNSNDIHILKNAGKLNLNKNDIFPHEITDIYGVICSGAYGDPNSWANFIYGKRPDGRTVRCKISYFKENISEGIVFSCVYVWSSYKPNKSQEKKIICASLFRLEDWHKAGRMGKEKQKEYLNKILRKRRIDAYQDSQISD